MKTVGPDWSHRDQRLLRRIVDSPAEIVWLRGIAGSGKSRLLATLATDRRCRDTRFLDGPTAAELRAVLSVLRRPTCGPALVVASRINDGVAGALLTARIYGTVDTVADRELFLESGELPDAFGRSGGWPMLADATASGREPDTARLLPGFLQQEVLPDLPTSLVTALLATLAVPLPEASLHQLFDEHADLHPLLRRKKAGIVLSSELVHDALYRLRSRRHVLPSAALARLVPYYASFADPALTIEALLNHGQTEEALDVFERAGGQFFGYRHGFRALESVLEAFGPDFERRSESLRFARLWLLIKSGRPHEVRLRLEALYPNLPIDLRGAPLPPLPYALLLRMETALDLDEMAPRDVVTSWARLEAMLPAEDHVAIGLLYNTMAIGFLQAGALTEARQTALEALRIYTRAELPYLVHFMHLHLTDLALRESALHNAKAHLAEATLTLERSQQAFNSEPAIIVCFRARLAYEEGRIEDCPTDVGAILDSLLRGDSWPDLITTVAGRLVFVTYWQHGLRAALGQLDHCLLTLGRRHGGLQPGPLLLLRVRLYQMARRFPEAGVQLEEIDLLGAGQSPRRRPGTPELRLLRLRQHVLEDRLAEDGLEVANALALEPGLTVRDRVSLTVLQAALQLQAGQSAAARRHLTSGLRLAEGAGLIGALLEEAPLLERLLPPLIRTGRPGERLMKAFAERLLRRLRELPTTPAHARALAGLTRQEHRVLGYVVDGYKNKEIARALALSEGTVKFHLQGLYAKFGVRRRSALRELVSSRGLVT